MLFWILLTVTGLLAVKITTSFEIRGLKRRLREVNADLERLNGHLGRARKRQREADRLEQDLQDRIDKTRDAIRDLHHQLVVGPEREEERILLRA